MRLSVKEADELAAVMALQGTDNDSLRAAIAEVKGSNNRHSSIPAKEVDDEEYIEKLRSQSTIEEGEDLECLICHQTFDQLVSGTCEICFRQWMLSAKRG